MTIHLENTFTVPVDVERAWEALVDIPLVASCVPGASVDGQDPDGAHLGKVGLRLGPVAVEYHGRIEVVRQDDATRTLSLRAQGRDARGQGTANASFALEIRPEGAETTARVVTDVEVTGKAAQFGRGIMEQVAKRLVGQFSTNLGRTLTQGQSAATPAAARGATLLARRPSGEAVAATAVGVVAAILWWCLRRVGRRPTGG